MSWQPIEAAPKDGTLVRVCGPVSEWDARWRGPMPGEPQAATELEFHWREEGTGRWADPTHWMPLPAPPETP